MFVPICRTGIRKIAGDGLKLRWDKWCEVGREFVKNENNGWVGGLLGEFEFSRASEVMAELHADKNGAVPTELILNFGARQKLTSRLILLLAAGTAVSGPSGERTHVRDYIGLQINLPHIYATHD
jgi:hypothetical protein